MASADDLTRAEYDRFPSELEGSCAEELRFGVRLRQARLARRLSLDQLATATGLTKGFLSQLERNMTAASLASLARICDALRISIGSLFQPPQTQLTRASDARTISSGGSGLKEHLLTPRGSTLKLIRSEIAPRGRSASYTLDADAEAVHVLQGTVSVCLEDESYLLAPGDTLCFAPRRPHSFHNPSKRATAVVLWALTRSAR